jgi:nitrate/nitrite transporter NarK
MQNQKQAKGKTLTLITLIIAAESIFFLPFVLARVFRPTLLDLFGISNTELGMWFSVYGIVAMVSYLVGGPLADRFPARKLMAWALWLTSAGGVVMSLVPSSRIMLFVYAFWGFSTICLFWAAMIRATREWGGTDFQGRAFGWLEGGRGTVAALMATLSFLLFSQIGSLRWVILATSAMTLLIGIMAWVFIPNGSPKRAGTRTKDVIREVSSLLRMRNTWLLSIIVLCAYIGYKITDDFSLFAREVLGFSEVHAAGIGTIALWIRALVAILAGFLADRFKRIDVIVVSFALTLAGGLLLGLGISDGVTSLLLLNLAFTAVGIYGVRTLYFAVMKEAKIPLGLTGTAVGIVSIVGFAPEVFISPWMGYLLDRNPGAGGHADVFLLLSAFSFAGLVTALLFRRSARF